LIGVLLAGRRGRTPDPRRSGSGRVPAVSTPVSNFALARARLRHPVCRFASRRARGLSRGLTRFPPRRHSPARSNIPGERQLGEEI
jgi:hypothetical protein